MWTLIRWEKRCSTVLSKGFLLELSGFVNNLWSTEILVLGFLLLEAWLHGGQEFTCLKRIFPRACHGVPLPSSLAPNRLCRLSWWVRKSKYEQQEHPQKVNWLTAPGWSDPWAAGEGHEPQPGQRLPTENMAAHLRGTTGTKERRLDTVGNLIVCSWQTALKRKIRPYKDGPSLVEN